jgi:hypothetical protein
VIDDAEVGPSDSEDGLEVNPEVDEMKEVGETEEEVWNISISVSRTDV